MAPENIEHGQAGNTLDDEYTSPRDQVMGQVGCLCAVMPATKDRRYRSVQNHIRQDDNGHARHMLTIRQGRGRACPPSYSAANPANQFPIGVALGAGVPALPRRRTPTKASEQAASSMKPN